MLAYNQAGKTARAGRERPTSGGDNDAKLFGWALGTPSANHLYAPRPSSHGERSRSSWTQAGCDGYA